MMHVCAWGMYTCVWGGVLLMYHVCMCMWEGVLPMMSLPVVSFGVCLFGETPKSEALRPSYTLST